MFPHLYGFRVNISLVQEQANKELLKILDKCEGSKVSSDSKFDLKQLIMFDIVFRLSFGMIHYPDQSAWWPNIHFSKIKVSVVCFR